MALDTNEKRLIQKLIEALTLMQADKQDIHTISSAKKIDDNFLAAAGKIFDDTEACDVCSHAFHSWRKTLDDDTILSFIDDWINWKKTHMNDGTKAKVIKMKKRS
jgi:hypothetical protein